MWSGFGSPGLVLRAKCHHCVIPLKPASFVPLVLICETTEAWRGEVTIPRSHGMYSSPSGSSLRLSFWLIYCCLHLGSPEWASQRTQLLRKAPLPGGLPTISPNLPSLGPCLLPGMIPRSILIRISPSPLLSSDHGQAFVFLFFLKPQLTSLENQDIELADL